MSKGKKRVKVTNHTHSTRPEGDWSLGEKADSGAVSKRL